MVAWVVLERFLVWILGWVLCLCVWAFGVLALLRGFVFELLLDCVFGNCVYCVFLSVCAFGCGFLSLSFVALLLALPL